MDLPREIRDQIYELAFEDADLYIHREELERCDHCGYTLMSHQNIVYPSWYHVKPGAKFPYLYDYANYRGYEGKLILPTYILREEGKVEVESVLPQQNPNVLAVMNEYVHRGQARRPDVYFGAKTAKTQTGSLSSTKDSYLAVNTSFQLLLVSRQIREEAVDLLLRTKTFQFDRLENLSQLASDKDFNGLQQMSLECTIGAQPKIFRYSRADLEVFQPDSSDEWNRVWLNHIHLPKLRKLSLKIIAPFPFPDGSPHTFNAEVMLFLRLCQIFESLKQSPLKEVSVKLCFGKSDQKEVDPTRVRFLEREFARFLLREFDGVMGGPTRGVLGRAEPDWAGFRYFTERQD